MAIFIIFRHHSSHHDKVKTKKLPIQDAGAGFEARIMT